MQSPSSKPALSRLSSKMPPCIVDLSLDSEDDCYIYPSKRHPAPQKHIRTPKPTRTPKPIRTPLPRSFSSSSSSVISFLSPPPRNLQVQTHITSFLQSPSKASKLESPTKTTKRKEPPKSFKIPPPFAPARASPFITAPAPPIFFEKRDLFVDDNEAPVPAAFGVPAGSQSPMDIDALPDSPIVLSSSPPAFHRGFPYPRPKTATVSAKKRLPPKRARPGVTSPAARPLKTVRREQVPNSDSDSDSDLYSDFDQSAGANKPGANCMLVKRDVVGISGGASGSKRPVSVTLSVQTNPTTSLIRQVADKACSDLKSGGQSDRLICRAHADPDCNAIGCVSDFFDEYSPFHNTLPEDKVVSKVQRPEVFKKLAPAVVPVADEVNIRALKRKYTGLLLAADTLDPAIRRPYMPLTSRRVLREMRTQPGVWEIFADFDECLIHVGFTPKECNILGSCIHTYLSTNPTPNTEFPELCESGEPSEDLHYYLKAAFTGLDPAMIFEQDVKYLMDQLPGRTKKDCVDFLMDATSTLPDPRDPFIIVDLLAGGKPKPPSRGVRRMLEELGPRAYSPMEALRARAAYGMTLFQPVWRFGNGASDILDVQWSSDGTRFGMASAAFSDGYNRAGNLMLGTSDPWKVKMLFKHAFKVPHQAVGNLDKFKWATVSCVRFSNTGSYFYSGSYDRSVKIWNGKTGQWISNIPLNSEVVTMATSPFRDHLVAAATKDGRVHIIRLADGKPVDLDELHINREDERKQGLYASCLQFGNKRQPNWLITGYDTSKEGQVYGGFAIFDVEAGKTVFNESKGGKRAYNTRHFDIAMHDEGAMLVTASHHRTHKVHSNGMHSALRVFDIRTMGSPTLIKCPQKDINRVTISPCQDYITSSGTGGSTLVWDLRNPSKPVKKLEHCESKLPVGPNTNLELDDTGVTFAQWGPYHDRFYTGSSDGIVKEWDITASNPFIRDIAKVDTQIMSAAFSPTWDELIVGECSGTATLFSTRGDEGVIPAAVNVDWTEDPDMMSPDDQMPMAVAAATDVVVRRSTDPPPSVEDSGVRLARQLVDEGKVWIRQGYAWAVDNTIIVDDDYDYDYDEMVI